MRRASLYTIREKRTHTFDCERIGISSVVIYNGTGRTTQSHSDACIILYASTDLVASLDTDLMHLYCSLYTLLL